MSKLVCLIFAAAFLLPLAKRQDDQFLKYKAVEAYEVRPGILLMPRYSENGEICEIGLERRHYSPEKIYLDSTLSREEIGQIADELAPANERGPKASGIEGAYTSIAGHGLTSVTEYENISIQIYGDVLPHSRKNEIVANDIAATIKWKNRKCQ
jgi:hypothetical protein